MTNCSTNLYTVKFTDTSKDSLLVSKGELITDKADIAFVGKTKRDYGEVFNENVLHLLEHFACPEDSLDPGNPDLASAFGVLLENPIEGQIWYNITQQKPFRYNGTSWGALGTAADIAGNYGVIAHGEQLPQPVCPITGYVFQYDECTWVVSPFNHPEEINFMQCFTDDEAIVTIQYRPIGSSLTNGYANYQIIGIRGNTNVGTLGPVPSLPVPETPTPTPTVTGTNDVTPTPTVTSNPTVTPTPTLTPTVTPAVTPSETPPPGVSLTPAATVTPTPEVTHTGTPAVTITPFATQTGTPVVTPTNTPGPTVTKTPSTTATSTPEVTHTQTPVPGTSLTPTPAATSTPAVTHTKTPSVTPTSTAAATNTPTPAVTRTSTPAPAASPTPTPGATVTPAVTHTKTPSVTPTKTPAVTHTNTPTPSPVRRGNVISGTYDCSVLNGTACITLNSSGGVSAIACGISSGWIDTGFRTGESGANYSFTASFTGPPFATGPSSGNFGSTQSWCLSAGALERSASVTVYITGPAGTSGGAITLNLFTQTVL